ncbi:hypothetical protein D3C75_1126050 [compost metagenome]
MPVADIKVDEIDHKTMPQTIKQVAERTADNKGIGDIVQLLLGTGAIHHHQQHHHDGDRNTGKEPALPATVIRQETERRAVVTRVVQVD